MRYIQAAETGNLKQFFKPQNLIIKFYSRRLVYKVRMYEISGLIFFLNE